MSKLLLGTVFGVFVGAFTMEVLNHKRPDLVRRIEGKASKVSAIVASAFHEEEDDIDEILSLEPKAVSK